MKASAHFVLLSLALNRVNITSAEAQQVLIYSFIEEGSDEVLATLQLSSLPATHNEVVGLTFSSLGQSIFGFGPVYTGTFDGEDGYPAIIDDGNGGLAAGNGSVIFDLDAPAPLDGPNAGKLGQLDAIMDNLNDDLRDVLDHYSSDLGSPFQTRVTGDWRLVPEPSSVVLLSILVLIGSFAQRHRSPQA